VITPCLNSVRYIARSVESVLRQAHDGVEHVVMDGGSSDGTLEVLKSYPHLQVFSAADRGIYDALNRGLVHTSGEIIGFLNADDHYAEDALAHIEPSFSDASIMAVAGGAVFFRESDDGAEQVVAQFSPHEADLLELSTLRSPVFNAWFFRKSLFTRIGRFDPSYRIAGDREFMLRLALSDLPYHIAGALVYRYRIHPGSRTLWPNDAVAEEIACEHIRITDAHMRRPDLSGRARTLISEACSRDTLRMAMRSLRRGEVRKLLAFIAAGTRHDRAWMLRFARAVTEVGLRRARAN
jgi:glycosyltransferase involved in cell wall biosynthesis